MNNLLDSIRETELCEQWIVDMCEYLTDCYFEKQRCVFQHKPTCDMRVMFRRFRIHMLKNYPEMYLDVHRISRYIHTIYGLEPIRLDNVL